ncbi:MAG: diguanylate cyclase [Tardiphaga sp.]|nr:diguanylate cyclase [Tardiphaga sp.]
MTGKNGQDAFSGAALSTAASLVVMIASPASAGTPTPEFVTALINEQIDPTILWEIALGGFVVFALLTAVILWAMSALRAMKWQQARRNAIVNSALNNIGQGVVIVNAKRQIIFCNDRYLDIYGLTRSDIAGVATGPELIELRRSRGMINLTVDEFRESARADSGYISDLPDGRSVLVRHRALPSGGTVSTHDDCSERIALSRELATTKHFLETVIENVPICIAAKSIEDGRYILANRAIENFWQRSRSQILGKRADEILTAENATIIKAADRSALAAPEGCVHDTFEITRDGRRRTVASNRVVVRDHDGHPTFLLALFEDVTDRMVMSRELERSKQFLELVIDNIPVSLSVQNPVDGRYLLLNRAAEFILDRPREDAIGLTPMDIFAGSEARSVMARDAAAVSKGGVVVEEQPVSTKGGPRMFVTRRATVLDDDGQPRYLIKTREDVTERREAEARMAHMAYHDALTELPNRASFLKSLTQMIEVCEHDKEAFAVLSVDLNGLKEVNDVFGHAVGDTLLVQVARRMEIAAAGSVVARLGGDEFGLIISGAQPDAGMAVAERLKNAMYDEFMIDGKAVRTTATMGLSLFPRDGADATALLANAGAALFRAKAKARGSIGLFEPQMDQQIRNRRVLHQDLSSAIRNGELSLHYQPQAKTTPDIAMAEITGFEALARWQHPTRGDVSPGEFIPLAEESGLIVEMGEWILREACREAAQWPQPLQIAVNLSPAQFLHGDLVGLVHSILLETGLSPGRLELEVTEGVLIEDFDRGLALLRRLKALGVRVSMDDFGSGYSSLTYLQAFPFDKIKIDRTFVMNLGRNPQSAAIIRAVVGLGRGLKISILAEGVETAEQLAFLAEEGCDGIQGYFLGRPAPIATYAAMIGAALPRTAAAERLAG